jgi:hypothetical protein
MLYAFRLDSATALSNASAAEMQAPALFVKRR